MAFEPSVAIFDACVLYPFHLRNVLVQAAVDRLVEARWTDRIHDEWIRNLLAAAPSIPSTRLETTCRLMNDALPTATVIGYEALISNVTLPDPSDRHVVAAALAAGGDLILTWNLRDFPTEELGRFGLRRETPDAFLASLYDAIPELTIGSLANARRNLRKSRVSAREFIEILERQKLLQFAMRMRRHSTDL